MRDFDDRLTSLESWITLLNDHANGGFLPLIHLYQIARTSPSAPADLKSVTVLLRHIFCRTNLL